MALGETPNLAARLQSLAAPDTVAISETTHRLVQGYFRCNDLGSPSPKGVETPLRVYRVVAESAAQSRLDVAGSTGLTPLVGGRTEVGLLRERWGAESRRAGPGGPAQRRGRYWQIAPGAHARRAGGGRGRTLANGCAVPRIIPTALSILWSSICSGSCSGTVMRCPQHGWPRWSRRCRRVGPAPRGGRTAVDFSSLAAGAGALSPPRSLPSARSRRRWRR